MRFLFFLKKCKRIEISVKTLIYTPQNVLEVSEVLICVNQDLLGFSIGRERRYKMKEQLLEILEKAKSDIKSAEILNQVEDFRIKYLGKKGELTTLLREMGKLSKEERPVIGKLANEVRSSIEGILEENKKVIKEKEKMARLESEVIDVTSANVKH